MPEHDESDPLQPKKTTSLGRLVALSAALSFALGAIAATAVVRSSGLRGSDLHETSKSATTLIKLASDPTKCVTVQKEGGDYNQWSELVLKDCSSRWDKKDVGQAFTVTVGDGGHGKITYRVWQGPAYRNGELCVADRQEFASRGSGVGLSECDDADHYTDFFWDSDTKTISLPGKTYEDDYRFDDDALKGNHLCVDVGTAEKYPKEAGKGDIGTKNPLILSPCQDGRYQLWDVATMVAPAVPPTLDYQCDPSGDWMVAWYVQHGDEDSFHCDNWGPCANPPTGEGTCCMTEAEARRVFEKLPGVDEEAYKAAVAPKTKRQGYRLYHGDDVVQSHKMTGSWGPWYSWGPVDEHAREAMKSCGG